MESPKVTNWGEFGVAAAEIAYDEPQVSVIVACADVCVKPPEKVVLTRNTITTSASFATKSNNVWGYVPVGLSLGSPLQVKPSEFTISVL